MLTLRTFKCERCADCCKYLTVKLSKKDISAIKEEGYDGFMEFDEHIKSSVLKRDDKGCVFLDKKTCRIYSIRPEVCRLYPFVGSDMVDSCKPELLGNRFKTCLSQPK